MEIMNILYIAIQRLIIHLPFMQHITFNSNQTLSNVLRQLGVNKTTLTKLMKTNKHDPNARKLKYTDFPKKYVWNTKYKKYSPRQIGYIIG